MLSQVDLPSFLDAPAPPKEVADKLAVLRQRIEAFQDCWSQHAAEQFVAADYELVFQVLVWIEETQPLIGRRFLEWGCGFAAVSCLASQLGWGTHAIEAHSDLIVQGRATIADWPAKVELFHGNFLPEGAEELADDPTLPSLGHGGDNPYRHWETDLSDFALIYSYPWPGEDVFHEQVFDRYAAAGALLLMFIGPNEMRLLRKTRNSAR